MHISLVGINPINIRDQYRNYGTLIQIQFKRKGTQPQDTSTLRDKLKILDSRRDRPVIYRENNPNIDWIKYEVITRNPT